MRLKLRNVLKIKNADIEIGGLTVLTGENDSGKSTVGKILFSILKAANNARQIDKMKTISLLKSELGTLKKMFHQTDPVHILDDIPTLSFNLIEGITFAEDLRKILETEAEKIGFSSRMIAMMRTRLLRIEQSVLKLDNPEVAVGEEFQAIARSEFMEPLNSYGSENSEILFHDDTTDADG